MAAQAHPALGEEVTPFEEALAVWTARLVFVGVWAACAIAYGGLGVMLGAIPAYVAWLVVHGFAPYVPMAWLVVIAGVVLIITR